MGNIFGKRSLGKTRRRWQDNIKFDVRKVSYEDGKWMELAQNCVRWQAFGIDGVRSFKTHYK